MENVNIKEKLTKKELLGYRQWLSELEEEGELDSCDSEVWECFDPQTAVGAQVYQSFTDEELLNLLITTMGQQGRKPRFDRIHVIYRRYLHQRFGGLNNAKECARVRIKQLEEQKRWPPDWHTRVSTGPLLARLEKKGRAVSGEDLELLERLCREARETTLPPYISISIRDRLNKLMDSKSALELMGIPVLNQAGLKRMVRYWNEGRKMEETI